MRIKIIGENNCARATRHLLRLAGFAVTEFLPADAVARRTARRLRHHHRSCPGPLTPLTPSSGRIHPTHHQHASASEEAPRSHRDASSPAFTEAATAGLPACCGDLGGSIHFDSVDSALEAAVLRHVTQLAAAPVIVDRPGGVVHSDRELRIVAPNTGDAKADEAAAVAIEFGVLRGLLDLTAPAAQKKARGTSRANRTCGDGADESAEDPESSRSVAREKMVAVWDFAACAGMLALLRAGIAAAPGRSVEDLGKSHRLKPVLLLRAALSAPEFLAEAQGADLPRDKVSILARG